MNISIEIERRLSPTCVDYRVEAVEGGKTVAAFYVQRVDPTAGVLAVLRRIADHGPDCCNDFTVTHTRWANVGTPYKRRISEWVEHCPHHIGIGFPAYHIGYGSNLFHLAVDADKEERYFECTYCGCVFPESKGIEVDRR
jgi:hypothetical protein